MTLTEIRAEMVMKTERKIQEMKNRNIALPAHHTDMCELCDQLSQEIYDFAVNTVIQIADRNHLRQEMATLLEAVHEDICALTNGAIDIILSSPIAGRYDLTGAEAQRKVERKAFRYIPVTGEALLRLFQGLSGWIRGRWYFGPAA
nr:hypothetical protein [uncultured Dyadobacter sp.]